MKDISLGSMGMRPLALVMTLAFFSQSTLVTPAFSAQDQDDAGRPKIGLVLSGGGARGAAHIGVLKVLEEYRVPIDFIAGTSMGAVVGGLYASGMSAEEIEKTIDNVDWAAAFDDNIPRKDRSFRRKRDDDLYLIKAKPGFNDGKLELQPGLIQGQKIDLMLERFTPHVAEIRDFDQLSIPFRAVASDLATGDPVVIGDGLLAAAMRASMSIPGFFTPMEIHDRMLVDGGVSNNLPIDVAREMGADIIIAIDISTPLRSKEELKSILSITAQITGILTRKNTEEQIATLQAHDIFLVPDLGDISTAAFDRASDAIPKGVTEARHYEVALRRLSLPESQYLAHVSARKNFDRAMPIIHQIVLNNNSRLGDAAVMSHLHIAEGEPLDIPALEAQIGTVYGLELFQIIFWELDRQDGQNILTIHVDEKPWGPNYIQFGLGVADDFSGDNKTNFALAYTRTAINPLGGEWRTAIAIGAEPQIFTELYQPLDYDNRYFVNPKLNYQKTRPNIFDSDGNKLAEIEVETTQIEVGVGRQLGTWGEIRLGANRGRGNLDVGIGNPALGPLLGDLDFDIGEAFVQLAADKLDSVNFPTSGYIAGVSYLKSLDSLGASDEYEQYTIGGTFAHTWGRNTGLFSFESVITPDNDAPIQGLPRVGGLFNLSGFAENELTGQHTARVSTFWYRKISDLALLPAYAGFSLEYGNAFQEKGDIKFDNGLWAGSMFVGLDTFVGPIYFAYGQAEGGNTSFYMFIGSLFDEAFK